MPFVLNDNNRALADSFRDPASLYRGAPFWSWNGELKEDELLRQIDVFNEMGIGGYHMHVRTGCSTPYLSDAFMARVKACRDHGREKGMLSWLYDEDRWPSGAAGGLVTKDHQYRQRHLLFTTHPYCNEEEASGVISAARGRREGSGALLARYAIRLKDKRLASYRVLAEEDMPAEGERCWYAYLEVDGDSSWFNNQAYVDTLNPAAIRRFIEVTHERYKEAVGDSFGTDVPAIFTDEPQFTHKSVLKFAESEQDAIFPWTSDLEAAFKATFGESILAHFPEVIWDLPDDEVSVWRYRYHLWVSERFAESFTDQIGCWCEENGIALTGHMMEETTLNKQTKALGEAMRSYRHMGIPGIDMLCDTMELTTAKQAQSAARQFGRPGVLSELYGVTGWHFDFMGHKRQGDWQAALGVLFRVHHLSWYCMRGEAKRDYPASIGYQSPWYKAYSTIEDHFARVGAVLSRGKPVCRVAMIHPVESYWISAGPMETSESQRNRLDDNFQNLTQWLLWGLVDFDYVSEGLLPDQFAAGGAGGIHVGEMLYDVVLVPGMRTMRLSTLQALETVADAGGRVLFVGQVPEFVDAEPSDRVAALAARCEQVAFEQAPVLDSLASCRDIDFRTGMAARPGGLLYQLREEGDDRYLFVCNTHKRDFGGTLSGQLFIKGDYEVMSLCTDSGKAQAVAAVYEDGVTKVAVDIPSAGHLLFQLSPGQRTQGLSLTAPAMKETGRIASPVAVTLDEPNVLLVDKAAFRMNDGEWEAESRILDIENIVRRSLGMPKKGGHSAQPWVDHAPAVELARVTLRMKFFSLVACEGAELALENLEESRVLFDGEPVDMTATGFFTDKAVQTIALPEFSEGEHELIVEISFTKDTSIEWLYLLGDFGVDLVGDRGVLTEPVQILSFGDWTTQGLPFYGGNVTYHCESPEDGEALQVGPFSGTAVKVASQGASHMVYRPPYMASVPLKTGKPVDLTVYGHRGNCFGPVHLTDPAFSWQGPNAWRTKGYLFSPEFHLKPLGITSGPAVMNKREKC